MATAVLQPTSLPIRSMSTPTPSTSSSSSSSSSSSQPLIDHALLMLTLSRRLSTTEHEQERAVEMREDALKLLVLGEEMQRAEERQSNGSSPQRTPPESPAVSDRRVEDMDSVELGKEADMKEAGHGEQQDGSFYHLIPPAYIFEYPPALSSSTSAAAAAAMQSLPTTALMLSSPSSPSKVHSLSRVNSASALAHLNPDAITSSLSTLLTQADLLLVRLHRKYDTYLSPLLSQSQSTLHTLMESEEARVMVDEGRDVVREWREFMGSREGDAMMSSLFNMMAAQQLGVGDLIKYATDAVGSIVSGSGSTDSAADTQSAASATAAVSAASSSTQPLPSSTSSALVPVNSTIAAAISASSNNHTFLYTLPEHIRSFLVAHPELNLFLLRAQSALLAPEPSSSTSPPSELDQLLSAFSERTSSLLTSLSSPSTAHQLPNGKTQLLSPRTSDLLSDLSSPLLHLIKSPERVFSEAVLLLIRGKSQCEQVLDDLKHLIIQQLSTALSNLSFPAIDSSNSSFQYSIDSFALHSFHLHADDIQLLTTDHADDGRLVIEIKRVDAEARDVSWTCKQLIFPYMSGSGTLDVRLREASMRVEVGVLTTAASTAVAGADGSNGSTANAGVRLVDLTFNFPSLSFHIANTSFSSVYNLLLSLFGPLLRSELERAVNVACREKVEELLSLVNEYGGGEVVRRWWLSSRKAKEDDVKEAARLNGHAKPSEVLRALTADVMRDSAEDDRNSRHATSAMSSAPPSPTVTTVTAVLAVEDAADAAIESRSLVDTFSTPPPPRHPASAHRSALVSQSTPVSACVSPSSTSSTSSSSSSSSSWSSGRLTPSSSSPFLRTSTPPILLAYPDTASGW